MLINEDLIQSQIDPGRAAEGDTPGRAGRFEASRPRNMARENVLCKQSQAEIQNGKLALAKLDDKKYLRLTKIS